MDTHYWPDDPMNGEMRRAKSGARFRTLAREQPSDALRRELHVGPAFLDVPGEGTGRQVLPSALCLAVVASIRQQLPHGGFSARRNSSRPGWK